MTARKIRNTWWVDFGFNHQRIRKRSPENSRAGALAYEAVVRQKLARGEELDAAKAPDRLPTFREFAQHWYDTYVRANNRPSERKSKHCILKAHLIPSFGPLPLDKITTLAVEEFKAERLRQGRSPKTVNNYLAVLSRCLRSAEEWLRIEALPRIKLVQVPPQKFDYLSVEESERLLAAPTDERWRSMIRLALRAGLRLGELKGLQWSDIDFAHGHLTVRRSVVGSHIGAPKNNRERQVPLTKDACAALRTIERTGPFVFARRGPGPLGDRTPRYALRAICDRIRLRRIGWHTLRHTFASQLAMKGVSLKAIQELLGHSQITTTMRYAHLGPSTLRDAVSVLGSPSRTEAQDPGQQAVNAVGVAEPPQQEKDPFCGAFQR